MPFGPICDDFAAKPEEFTDYVIHTHDDNTLRMRLLLYVCSTKILDYVMIV